MLKYIKNIIYFKSPLNLILYLILDFVNYYSIPPESFFLNSSFDFHLITNLPRLILISPLC